jgi:RNA polymerase sigma factor (TIGR02999 family)
MRSRTAFGAVGCAQETHFRGTITSMASDPDIAQGTVTRLLAEVRAGVVNADNRLFAHVQGDLRRLAQGLLHRATELVNLAVLRLLDHEGLSAEDRRHFFFLLGRAMHDALVDEARRADSLKRGGGRSRESLMEFEIDRERIEIDPMDLDAALQKLAGIDPQASQVLQLRFFAGLPLDRVAESMGLTFHHARRTWEYAKAWLIDFLSESKSREESPV